MKHRKLTAALALATCTAMLLGCSCVSRAVDEGNSMMNSLESSLTGGENSQGNLMNDSSLNDSRLENSAMDSNMQNSNMESSRLENSGQNGSNSGSGHGMVNDNGDTSGNTGTTNGINGDGSDEINDNTGTENSADATNQQQLTEDEAIEIALNEVGATRDSVSQLTVHLDYDDTTAEPYYEVDFNVDDTEYDFEISALDGSLLDLDTEGY